ncbi:MAG TPA: ergothioneine biosynthesis protein EgtB [Burkholderiaceae bacterium]|jgi:ergothioneine biosynthesis protein EgtB|nr:ergothioneine biosynthesis protein EgtB [Burkholderiaceae bacterium]
MQAQIDAVLIATENLLQRFNAVRKRSVSLTEPLSEEDCCVQSMPDASPIKWHLAHTTWFFETFILERFEPDFRPHHQAFRVLFNSYYNGVGQKHPRAQRGLLTRPSTDEVIAYRHNVDARMGVLLGKLNSEQMASKLAELAALTELGIQHEQQHQELMMTDVKHLLSMNPLFPAYVADKSGGKPISTAATWLPFDAGVVEIGHRDDGFCFDNELPRHRQFVEAFSLASRLVTNAEFLAFIDDGGYRNPALWLSEGWDWVRSNALTQPLYWHHTDNAAWQEFTLHGLQHLAPSAPAIHLSYFEADAYANWVSARLPTEFEWEVATQAKEAGLTQLFGSVWQWTSSSYAPYPGFVVADGAIGEYNGKFMVNQYVLRGSSSVTPPGHARASYRNFFPAGARWQFSGIRLAKSGLS